MTYWRKSRRIEGEENSYIIVDTFIVYCVARARSELFQSPDTEISFPHESIISFFVRPLRASITTKVLYRDLWNNQTILQKQYFMKKNDLVLFILCVTMHEGYNIMNIICNQKFMFCKYRGIDFSVPGCAGIRVICELSKFGDFHFTARQFLGLPLNHQLDGRRLLSNERFNSHKKLNFRYRRDKIVNAQ